MGRARFKAYSMRRLHSELLLSYKRNTSFAIVVCAGSSASGSRPPETLLKSIACIGPRKGFEILNYEIVSELRWELLSVKDRAKLPFGAILIWSSANLISAHEGTRSYHSHAPRRHIAATRWTYSQWQMFRSPSVRLRVGSRWPRSLRGCRTTTLAPTRLSFSSPQSCALGV
jgi:hypothetical protein